MIQVRAMEHFPTPPSLLGFLFTFQMLFLESTNCNRSLLMSVNKEIQSLQACCSGLQGLICGGLPARSHSQLLLPSKLRGRPH